VNSISLDDGVEPSQSNPAGTPEEIAETPDTPTGEYLKKMLAKRATAV